MKAFILISILLISLVPVAAEKKIPAGAERHGLGKYMDRDEIAEAFEVKVIYDPVFKKNRDVKKLSRERLIEYLNNPISRRTTFGPDNTKKVREKLHELGLSEERDLRKREYFPVKKPSSKFSPISHYKGYIPPEERTKTFSSYTKMSQSGQKNRRGNTYCIKANLSKRNRILCGLNTR